MTDTLEAVAAKLAGMPPDERAAMIESAVRLQQAACARDQGSSFRRLDL